MLKALLLTLLTLKLIRRRLHDCNILPYFIEQRGRAICNTISYIALGYCCIIIMVASESSLAIPFVFV